MQPTIRTFCAPSSSYGWGSTIGYSKLTKVLLIDLGQVKRELMYLTNCKLGIMVIRSKFILCICDRLLQKLYYQIELAAMKQLKQKPCYHALFEWPHEPLIFLIKIFRKKYKCKNGLEAFSNKEPKLISIQFSKLPTIFSSFPV